MAAIGLQLVGSVIYLGTNGYLVASGRAPYMEIRVPMLNFVWLWTGVVMFAAHFHLMGRYVCLIFCRKIVPWGTTASLVRVGHSRTVFVSHL